jgi:hypothetical protein
MLEKLKVHYYTVLASCGVKTITDRIYFKLSSVLLVSIWTTDAY